MGDILGCVVVWWVCAGFPCIWVFYLGTSGLLAFLGTVII